MLLSHKTNSWLWNGSLWTHFSTFFARVHHLCFFFEYEKDALLRQHTIETENFVIELGRPLDKSLDCVLPGKLVLALLDVSVFSVFSFPRLNIQSKFIACIWRFSLWHFYWCLQPYPFETPLTKNLHKFKLQFLFVSPEGMNVC